MKGRIQNNFINIIERKETGGKAEKNNNKEAKMFEINPISKTDK